MKICYACNANFDGTGWTCPVCSYTPPQVHGFPALAPDLSDSGGGFNPEYFEQLASLEHGNFWFQSRNSLILMLLKRHTPDMRSYLEIGCGTGFVLSGVASNFPVTRLMGAEIFSTGLQHAAQRVPRAQFIQMDARRIPFDAHFDALGAFDVLEHIEEDTLVLAQIGKALKPGGKLVLTVPQHPALWSAQDKMACHVRRYTASELNQKLADTGFDVIDSGSFVSLLLPLMWLSRRLSRDNGNIHDPMAELRIGRVLNGMLLIIMRIEMLLTRAGIRFPAGGSLFVVARKRA